MQPEELGQCDCDAKLMTGKFHSTSHVFLLALS